MSSPDTVKLMVSLHEKLNTMQGYPVVGPFVVSPVKAVVSIAQTIAGIIGSIMGMVGVYVFNALGKEDRCLFHMKMIIGSREHLHIGLCQLACSIINGGTCGIFASHIAKTFGSGLEGPWRKVEVIKRMQTFFPDYTIV